MATVTYQEYDSEKAAFFEKHDYNYKIDTSPMDEYGRYYKTYAFEDGAAWYELMSHTYEHAVVEVQKASVTVEVEMLCTEYWSSEAPSKFYYEKF